MWASVPKFIIQNDSAYMLWQLITAAGNETHKFIFQRFLINDE